MTNILLLQPIRPDHPPALRKRADELIAAMLAANPAFQFTVCQDDAPIARPAHPSKYAIHAAVRNYMLDRYLRPEHDAVLWVDSDLVEYPADIVTRLVSAWQMCPYCGTVNNFDSATPRTSLLDIDATFQCVRCGQLYISSSSCIAAPLALLDKCGERFYDIGGFIENGRRFSMVPPYCTQTGPVWELDSVGCLYLVPASLYLQGVRYAPPSSDYYVEHWSVMQQAKKRGVRILALRDVVCKHAYMPDYGLGFN